MQNILKIFVILFISSMLSFCKKKDQWKLPTDVAFKMDINRTVSSNGKLEFTKGVITLASFNFEGKREQGDDVYFSKSFSNGLNIVFDPNTTISELDFDIPQGTYNKIAISFETSDDYGDESIIVEGTYIHTNGSLYPIKFEFNDSEYFSIIAKSVSGNSQIILNQNVASFAKIKLNPLHWFQVISTSMLDNADLVDINGVSTIVVSEDENENIYNLVVDRIDESSENIFQ